jgi:hypothetical protein
MLLLAKGGEDYSDSDFFALNPFLDKSNTTIAETSITVRNFINISDIS